MPLGSAVNPSTNAVDGILTNLQEPGSAESWLMIDFKATILIAGVNVWNRGAVGGE